MPGLWYEVAKTAGELADTTNIQAVLGRWLLALRQGSEVKIKNIRFSVRLTRQSEEMED